MTLSRESLLLSALLACLCTIDYGCCKTLCNVTAKEANVYKGPSNTYFIEASLDNESVFVSIACAIPTDGGPYRLGVQEDRKLHTSLLHVMDCTADDRQCLLEFSVSRYPPSSIQYIMYGVLDEGAILYTFKDQKPISASLEFEFMSESKDFLQAIVSIQAGFPTPRVVADSLYCDGEPLNMTTVSKSLLVRSLDLIGRRKCTVNITNGVEVVQISASDFNITTTSTLTTTIATSSAPETNTVDIVLGVLLGLSILVIACLVAFLRKISCMIMKQQSERASGPNISIHGHAYIQCGDKSQQLITTSTGNQHLSENIQDDDGVVFSPSAPNESLDSMALDGANPQLQTTEPEELNDMTSVAVQEDLPLDKMGVLDQCRG